MPRKIITVTLNSSIDVIIEVPFLIDDSVVDADSCINIAAGKGINVARALAALGEHVLALGIVGRESKHVFSKAASGRIGTDFVYTEGTSRRNFTLIQKESGVVTHIRSKGFMVNNTILSRVKRKLKNSIEKKDIVVFCGSLPPGADDGTYRDFIEMCTSRGALVVLDTSGTPLLNALAAKPYMIKPNREELLETFNLGHDVLQGEIIRRMHAIAGEGSSYVAVSLGVHGVLVVKKNEEAAVKGSLDLGPEYARRESVGSGDAMLAGFVYGMKRKFPFMEMIRWGVACGAANMLTKIPGDIKADDVYSLFPKVQIETIPMERSVSVK